MMTPYPHAELLNCLVAMQDTLLYAARRVTIREAESVIVSLAAQVEATMQDRVALAMQVEALTAERDDYRTKYNDTYRALDDCARENISLRAELDRLKKQEPVGKFIGVCPDGELVQLYEDVPKETPLYLAAGAQPSNDELAALRADAERYRGYRDMFCKDSPTCTKILRNLTPIGI